MGSNDMDRPGGASASNGGFVPRLRTLGLVAILALSIVPTASAHVSEGSPVSAIPQWYGLVFLVGGLVVLGASVLSKRTGRIRPIMALYGVFLGIFVTAIGAIGFTELAPEASYTASSMPFDGGWYEPVTLLIGSMIVVLSVVLGRLRWPTRPRYTVLGVELGLWVAYPALVAGGEYTHPLGYALVVSVPITVGYILRKDCWDTLRTVLRDRTACRFGVGVGLVIGLFFMFAAGFMSFFPQEGIGAPETTTIVVIQSVFPLVMWPTFEWFFPSIPFFGMVSVGVLIVVGMIGALVGLNAAILARVWTAETAMDLSKSTAGTATFVGSNACSCCGPILAKFAILAVGPSAAAPFYWILVDLDSPVGILFLATSIALLVASLLSAVGTVAESPACTLEGTDTPRGVQAD